jgi:1-aminocyclopropane-1-carboxylate deaminase
VKPDQYHPLSLEAAKGIWNAAGSYKQGAIPKQASHSKSISSHWKRYFVSEGGSGALGVLGAASIMDEFDASIFSHIICSVGSGTMAAGLLSKLAPHQQLIGISSQKNNHELKNALLLQCGIDKQGQFELEEDFHFGGFAKHPPELLSYMCELWERESLPTDIVYTSKLCFAVEELIARNRFDAGSRILVIHSGGLQGNQSLNKGILPF